MASANINSPVTCLLVTTGTPANALSPITVTLV